MINCDSERTEDSSASQYFQFYGYLSQQQNMMQDFIRTSTYQKAILDNPVDFNGKVVLDVGAGSGILSFFAQQSGARRVRVSLPAFVLPSLLGVSGVRGRGEQHRHARQQTGGS